jgi:hypothetical protein
MVAAKNSMNRRDVFSPAAAMIVGTANLIQLPPGITVNSERFSTIPLPQTLAAYNFLYKP